LRLQRFLRLSNPPQSEERTSPKEIIIDDVVFVSINFENVDTMRRAINGDGPRKAANSPPETKDFELPGWHIDIQQQGFSFAESRQGSHNLQLYYGRF
jgi:hypothetical protein